MERYRLLVKKSVARDLRAISKKDVRRILKRIETLTVNPCPNGCEKLTDQERYRVRQGSYRIIYEVQDDAFLVVVVKVGHRKNVYRH
ncbi:TPA: type II toxin-antitoxin system mRNA interferase toxin, RelE/StbE family [Candidatus Acetothermia bacterium]|nr:type II toxin-antitoxin system mRNA interferase toxin, RelE/StbE family [Candidatus Acetothermia bacterium]